MIEVLSVNHLMPNIRNKIPYLDIPYRQINLYKWFVTSYRLDVLLFLWTLYRLNREEEIVPI